MAPRDPRAAPAISAGVCPQAEAFDQLTGIAIAALLERSTYRLKVPAVIPPIRDVPAADLPEQLLGQLPPVGQQQQHKAVELLSGFYDDLHAATVEEQGNISSWVISSLPNQHQVHAKLHMIFCRHDILMAKASKSRKYHGVLLEKEEFSSSPRRIWVQVQHLEYSCNPGHCGVLFFVFYSFGGLLFAALFVFGFSCLFL